MGGGGGGALDSPNKVLGCIPRESLLVHQASGARAIYYTCCHSLWSPLVTMDTRPASLHPSIHSVSYWVELLLS